MYRNLNIVQVGNTKNGENVFQHVVHCTPQILCEGIVIPHWHSTCVPWCTGQNRSQLSASVDGCFSLYYLKLPWLYSFHCLSMCQPPTVFKDGRPIPTSSRCTKLKRNHLGYRCCHLAPSYRARVCAVVIEVWSRIIEVPPIRSLDQSRVGVGRDVSPCFLTASNN